MYSSNLHRTALWTCTKEKYWKDATPPSGLHPTWQHTGRSQPYEVHATLYLIWSSAQLSRVGRAALIGFEASATPLDHPAWRHMIGPSLHIKAGVAANLHFRPSFCPMYQVSAPVNTQSNPQEAWPESAHFRYLQCLLRRYLHMYCILCSPSPARASLHPPIPSLLS